MEAASCPQIPLISDGCEFSCSWTDPLADAEELTVSTPALGSRSARKVRVAR